MLVFLAALSTSPQAFSLDKGDVIWNSIAYKMKKSVVLSTYPDGVESQENKHEVFLKRHSFTENCSAIPTVTFKRKKARKVTFNGGGSLISPCADELKTFFSSKYGEPNEHGTQPRYEWYIWHDGNRIIEVRNIRTFVKNIWLVEFRSN